MARKELAEEEKTNILGCVDFSQPLFTTPTSLITTGIYLFIIFIFFEHFEKKNHVFVYMKVYQ
jgi:hypothetical protein